MLNFRFLKPDKLSVHYVFFVEVTMLPVVAMRATQEADTADLSLEVEHSVHELHKT